MATVSYLRRESPSLAIPFRMSTAEHALAKRLDVSDSDSDDEPPPALRFSKVTQALLAEVPVSTLSPTRNRHGLAASTSRQSQDAVKPELDTPSRAPGLKIIRRASPKSLHTNNRGSTPPRVVRIVSRAPDSTKRSTSVSGSFPHRSATREPTPDVVGKSGYVTPGPRLVESTRARANSDAYQSDHASPADRGHREVVPMSAAPDNLANDGAEAVRDQVFSQEYSTSTRYMPQTLSRARNASADVSTMHSSQRIKRVGPTTGGSLFRSKPVRRGFRRRDSEENASANEEAQSGPASASTSNGTPWDFGSEEKIRSRSRSGSVHVQMTAGDVISTHDFAHASAASASNSRPPSRGADSHASRPVTRDGSRPPSRHQDPEPSADWKPSTDKPRSRQALQVHHADIPADHASVARARRPSIDRQVDPTSAPRPSQTKPALKINPSQYSAAKTQFDDQENVPPPTFRRNKDQQFRYLGQVADPKVLDEDKMQSVRPEQAPITTQPDQQRERRVLSSISSNTPRRPAPAPPPKMSVLETATTTAGASVTKSKKKRSHVVVNGKIFTQMGKIGKGGSSDVFCVMAENYKMFALKRVKLDDCDESAVRGFKGEIDLLNKLTEVDRVVRLFDWELNESKQELSVLMEKGDTDLNRLLAMKLNGPDAKFDSAFVRYYWNEMLECVQAVHEHDIVHSDLKPANFLFVQGRLKLIDFGIANAIDTDNTCNVHRDSHVGTPNYMSPESITDTNASQHGSRDAAGRPLKKDMRIGKSSDVWSLGCILYQMTYGRPPFAHIANQISRIMAITNPKHTIEFPERGLGDVLVPPMLRNLLRRCLNRDPTRRPRIPEMLAQTELFINPDAHPDAVVMTQDMLGRIIDKVVERCRDTSRPLPTADELKLYPSSFMNKVREMQAIENT